MCACVCTCGDYLTHTHTSVRVREKERQTEETYGRDEIIAKIRIPKPSTSAMRCVGKKKAGTTATATRRLYTSSFPALKTTRAKVAQAHIRTYAAMNATALDGDDGDGLTSLLLFVETIFSLRI